MSSVGYESEIAIPREQPLPPAAEPTPHEKGTYGQILKSSVLIG